MNKKERNGDPVRSPCINVCRLDHLKRCFGCGRTVAEIAAWGGLSNTDRKAILKRISDSGPPPEE